MSTVRVQLTGMAHGGAAVGRDASGRVVFVDGGLPPEAADAVLHREGPRHAHGVLAALPQPASDDRVTAARCPHFGDWPQRGLAPATACGGCQWQHMRYEAQLRHKRLVVVDALRRIGRLDHPPVAATVGMAEPWGYRNRLTLRPAGDGLGLVALDGEQRVPIRDCPIAHPLVTDLLDALGPELEPGVKVVLRAGVRTGDRMIVLVAPREDVESIDVDVEASVVLALPDRVELVAGRPYLVERLNDRPFLIPPLAFFQVNTLVAEQLVQAVREAVPEGTDLLVDAFSGVGTLAVSVADRAGSVVAVERDADAVAAAVENAVGLDHVTLLEADAAEGLAYVGTAPDVLIVDPPRAGLSGALLRLVTSLAPPTIIYVSCEPATLARDAGVLAGAGWRLTDCRPFDMFPHGFHVETVSVFQR